MSSSSPVHTLILRPHALVPAKKLLSINGCPLCSLTHSLAGERADWKSCRDSIGVAVDYIHRDELTAGMNAAIGNEALPARGPERRLRES